LIVACHALARHIGCVNGVPCRTQVSSYDYLDKAGTGLDFAAMVSSLEALEPGAVVLLHAAAHNPTGVDPTPAQWSQLADLFVARGLVALFDTACESSCLLKRGQRSGPEAPVGV
jgi:aspartate/tyrosine/aromatic aminotransferase